MKRLFVFIAVLLVAGAGVALAKADGPSLIKEQGAWKSYSFFDKEAKICFMSSAPQRRLGKVKKRGDTFFFVTYWPGEKEKSVVSVDNGYTFRPDSAVTVKIDGQTFSLFTQGGKAWTRDAETDNALAGALRRGSTLIVKGTSQDGVDTTDTYSLVGSGAIYDSVVEACGGKKKEPEKKAAPPVKKEAAKASPAKKSSKKKKK